MSDELKVFYVDISVRVVAETLADANIAADDLEGFIEEYSPKHLRVQRADVIEVGQT